MRDDLSGGAVGQKADQTELPKNQISVVIHPTVRITPTRTMAAGQSLRKRSSFSEMGIWFREPALRSAPRTSAVSCLKRKPPTSRLGG
jgi:hypothetical protein